MKLLIGYGNTLRRDDGVGWQIVSQLAPHYTTSDVRCLTVHQLLPEVAALVADAAHVVFADASVQDEPGTVRVCRVQPLEHLEEAHAMTAPGIMHLAHFLYGKSPPAHLVTITGADFGLGEGLSAIVQAAIPQAVAEVRRLLTT